MVEIEIQNIRSRIVGDLEHGILQNINNALSYEIPGAYFARKYNPYAGTVRLFSMTGQSFPTGLLHYVLTVLKRCGVSVHIKDLRNPSIPGTPLPLHGFKLRQYQQDAIDTAIKSQRGIIQLGTGGGKTNIFTGIVAKLNVRTLILIHKTDIFYQIVERLEKALKVPIGKIGDGECDIQDITVGMIQTLATIDTHGRKVEMTSGRYKVLPDSKESKLKKQVLKAYLDTVECLITDECHHVPSDSFIEVHKRAKNAFFRFGMSASPWRETNDDMLIEAYHSKIIYKKIASNLIDEGFLVKPLIQLFKFSHPSQATRVKKHYSKVYSENVVHNEERNRLIVQLALKSAKAGKKTLIAITHIEHGKILEAMLQQIEPESIFVYGESNSELRTNVLKELNDGRRKIVICTTIFGEGIDVPNLDVLINAKAGASSVDAFQLIGRILRHPPGKERAYLLDIYDSGCKYLGSHSKARRKIYETEPNYMIKEVKSVSKVILDDDKW